MKTCIFLLGVLTFSGLTFAADETTPRLEVGATYSFVHTNRARDISNINLNGGSGTAVYNLNSVVGLVADFGGYHSKNAALPSNNTVFTYLFGPRFNWRMSRIVPYAQFLFGGARLTGNVPDVGGGVRERISNAFATSAGGGVDIVLAKHITLKPVQVEYLMTQLPESFSSRASPQNSIIDSRII